jgi:hypothetical protein
MLLPDSNNADHVATVRLTEGPQETSSLHDAIGDRHSNRGPYTNTAISPDVLSALDAVSTGLDGVGIRWFTSVADRAGIGALIIDATQAIVNDEQQSKDSFAWLRSNRIDIDAHIDCAASAVIMGAGLIAGAALIAAAVTAQPGREQWFVALVMATVPFVAMTWWTIITPVVSVVALTIGIAATRRSAGFPETVHRIPIVSQPVSVT